MLCMGLEGQVLLSSLLPTLALSISQAGNLHSGSSAYQLNQKYDTTTSPFSFYN